MRVEVRRRANLSSHKLPDKLETTILFIIEKIKRIFFVLYMAVQPLEESKLRTVDYGNQTINDCASKCAQFLKSLRLRVDRVWSNFHCINLFRICVHYFHVMIYDHYGFMYCLAFLVMYTVVQHLMLNNLYYHACNLQIWAYIFYDIDIFYHQRVEMCSTSFRSERIIN